MSAILSNHDRYDTSIQEMEKSKSKLERKAKWQKVAATVSTVAIAALSGLAIAVSVGLLVNPLVSPWVALGVMVVCTIVSVKCYQKRQQYLNDHHQAKTLAEIKQKTINFFKNLNEMTSEQVTKELELLNFTLSTEQDSRDHLPLLAQFKAQKEIVETRMNEEKKYLELKNKSDSSNALSLHYQQLAIQQQYYFVYPLLIEAAKTRRQMEDRLANFSEKDKFQPQEISQRLIHKVYPEDRPARVLPNHELTWSEMEEIYQKREEKTLDEIIYELSKKLNCLQKINAYI